MQTVLPLLPRADPASIHPVDVSATILYEEISIRFKKFKKTISKNYMYLIIVNVRQNRLLILQNA